MCPSRCWARARSRIPSAEVESSDLAVFTRSRASESRPRSISTRAELSRLLTCFGSLVRAESNASTAPLRSPLFQDESPSMYHPKTFAGFDSAYDLNCVLVAYGARYGCTGVARHDGAGGGNHRRGRRRRRGLDGFGGLGALTAAGGEGERNDRSEEHTSELQ